MLCILLEGVGIDMVIRPAHMVQAGPVGGNLSTASKTYEGNHSKV
jgi:hypothetical protein